MHLSSFMFNVMFHSSKDVILFFHVKKSLYLSQSCGHENEFRSFSANKS
jgi:hypothetical protein